MIASWPGSRGTPVLGCLPGSALEGTAALPAVALYAATFNGLHWPEMLAAAGRNLFYFAEFVS